MRGSGFVTRIVLAFATTAIAQAQLTTFKTEARSAFVWGEDAPGGAVSWTIPDPLTGHEVLKLSYAGVEVSSRMGFEKLRKEQVGELIAYTTTIVNNTHAKLAVDYGGITVDGHIVLPLSLLPESKHAKGKRVNTTAETVVSGALYCFKSGFLLGEHFLPQPQPSLRLSVEPQTFLTVSSVIKDPRPYPMRCSIAGCFPTGTIRYSIRVGGHDYIFTWPGRSIAYCGR